MSEITLLNADCNEALKKIGGGTVDLIIMDPPYEFYKGGGGGAFGSKKRKYHADYLALYKETQNESDRINANKVRNREELKLISYGFEMSLLDVLDAKMKRVNIYIWCSKAQVGKIINHYENKGCAVDILTWHKTNPTPTCNNTYLSDTEYLIFAREKGVKIYGNYQTKKKWYVTKANVEDKKKWEHPTIKPLFIIENLIINSSLEGQTVLDCFMGSGTTGVACKKLNRNFIGIEIDEKYFNIAKERIGEASVETIEEVEEVEIVEESGQLTFF